jgi:hypothetical protein
MRSIQEAGDLTGDESRTGPEGFEGRSQRRVAFIGSPEKRVVCRSLLRLFPDALDRVELGRVRRQSSKLNAFAVRHKPGLTFVAEVMEGRVVDHEEDFAPRAPCDELEEVQKSLPVEDRRELVEESRFLLKRYGAKDVRRLSYPESVYPRLRADPRPCLVESAAEPEAGLVFEHDDASAGCGLFFIAGNFLRSQ